MSSRAIGRNVHIYDPNDPYLILGGLLVTRGMTNANLYSMVDIILTFTTSFTLQLKSGITIPRDSYSLEPGSYFVVSAGSFTINSEPWLVRADSLYIGPTAEFCNSIRDRDRQCVISGSRMGSIDDEYWEGLEVTHIFPQAHENHWNTFNYGSMVTIPPKSGRSIDSVQNGMLLRSDIRCHFESYLVSISPDDNYKIVSFQGKRSRIAGPYPSNLEAFLADSRRPLDQFLRWHHRQTVLANVRRQGEPLFECHFPPDPDIPSEDMELEGNGTQLSGQLADPAMVDEVRDKALFN